MAVSRRIFALLLPAAILAGMLSADPVAAGNGDGNNSAPYVTVDPETGKLVTVNPGPERAMHPPPPADGTADNSVDQPAAAGSGPQASAAADPGKPTSLLPVFSLLLAALFAAVTVHFLRIARSRNGSSSASTEFAKQDGTS